MEFGTLKLNTYIVGWGNKSIKIFSSQSSNILNRLMGLKLNNKNDDIISKD